MSNYINPYILIEETKRKSKIGDIKLINNSFRMHCACHYCGAVPSKYFISLGDIVVQRRVIACCEKCAIMNNRSSKCIN